MKRLIIATGAVIAFLLAFSIQSASAQDVMYGCVGKKGQLRIVGGPGECKSSETEIWWNQQGPQGEPGEPGLPGQDGDPGPPGPAGEGCVKVYSAIGEELGMLINFTPAEHGTVVIYLPSLQKFMQIKTSGEPSGRNHFEIAYLYYQQQGCPENETPYLQGVSFGEQGYSYFILTFQFGPGEFKHYVIEESCFTPMAYQSHYHMGDSCVDEIGQIGDACPLSEVTLPFLYPIAVPFTFE